MKQFKPIVLLIIFGLVIISHSTGLSQDRFGFGVKAGLTFSKFLGPSEIGSNGEELERYSNEGGFHLGAMFKYRFSRVFGLESGFYYHQMGTKYEYDGESYFIFRDLNNEFKYGLGNREETIEITNGYLQIPLKVYYRVGKLFEFSAGGYMGLLVSSNGQSGEIIFRDGVSSITGEPIDPLRVTLGYKYLRDETGEYKGVATRTIEVDGETLVIPRTFGAYYTFTELDENLFKTLDLGLTAGIKVFLNESLFIGTQVFYGLSDVTSNNTDFSRLNLNEENQFNFLNDEDTNLSFQVSVGFAF